MGEWESYVTFIIKKLMLSICFCLFSNLLCCVPNLLSIFSISKPNIFPQTSLSVFLFHFIRCFVFSPLSISVCVCVFTRSIPSVSLGKRTMEFCSVAKHSGSVRLSPHLHNKNEVRAFPRRSTGLPPISTNTHPHTNTHMHSLSSSRYGMEITGSQSGTCLQVWTFIGNDGSIYSKRIHHFLLTDTLYHT